MSSTTVALIAENFVLAIAITAAYLLLRQGGGLQVKTPPPKKAAQPDDTAAMNPADKPPRSAS